MRDANSRRRRLERYFGGLDRQVATEAELIAAGFGLRALTVAVAAGELRDGLSGYWLPQPPDPGAMLVFRCAMRAADDDAA